jgi:hypothetical protein
MSKPCNKMGFTERASCRPYKNCYKSKRMNGGKSARTLKSKSKPKSKSKSSTKRKTMKKSENDSGNVSPSKKHMNVPAFIYHSEHVSYTSHPDKNTPYGKRTVVNIKNGAGEKKLEILDKKGKTVKVNKQKLNADEVCELKRGNYVPGLWLSV